MARLDTRDFIKKLDLIPHPEGGYFAETDRQTEQWPSPFAEMHPRPLASSIFYLLDYASPQGYVHMNKSVTYHIHHFGRAEYILVYPGASPRMERKIVGPDIDNGEVQQLVVGTGVWKMSHLLKEDMEAVEKGVKEKYEVGCLITEVVVPGFHWDDHKYLTKKGLGEMIDAFKGDGHGELAEAVEAMVRDKLMDQH